MGNSSISDEKIESMRKTSIMIYASMAVIILAIIIYIIVVDMCNPLVVGLAFLSLAIAFFVATRMKSQIMPYLSEKLISELNTRIKSIEFDPKKGLPEKIFSASDFVKSYKTYSSSNLLVGNIDNYDFIFSEAVVRNTTSTSTEKNPVVIFRGIIGITDAKNEEMINMVIAPDISNKFLNSFFEDAKKGMGSDVNIIRLENPEFERYFEVYCQDQIMARRIITLKFMENLVKLRNEINKNITVIYKGTRIYFFVEGGRMFDAFKLYLHGVNTEIVEETSVRMNMLADVVSAI